MTDYTGIVKWLRVAAETDPWCDKAADAIESLQREVARLQCDYDELDAENRALADYKAAVAAVDEMRSRKDWRISTLKRMQDGGCDHEWVSARNEVIQSGEYCPKCNAVRAEPRYYDSIGGELSNGAKGFT